jgi:dinuclear metal center YbgI/SA1388 family protein
VCPEPPTGSEPVEGRYDSIDLRVVDIAALLDQWYPPALAEEWDVVGLTVGDPDDQVTGIHLAVEPTAAVLDEAVAAGADLLITHHPLLLRGVDRVRFDLPKGRLIEGFVRQRVGLFVAHTNADAAVGGVVDCLADALGLSGCRPLAPAPAEPTDKLITYVPESHTEAVIDALAAAGAGRIGAYERCAFAGTGTGTFRPLAGASPYLGTVGAVERVVEARIEMVLARRFRSAVLSALLAAHPYDVPAWDLYELAEQPSAELGLGRVGELARPISLRAFARRVSATLPATPTGIRVGGDLDRPVRTVAVLAGAGDSLLDAARTSGADAYVTSDLRHHPASEALAWSDAPALIDIPHWAAEWLWLPVLERRLAAALAGRGTSVPTLVSALVTDPWVLHLT